MEWTPESKGEAKKTIYLKDGGKAVHIIYLDGSQTGSQESWGEICNAISWHVIFYESQI